MAQAQKCSEEEANVDSAVALREGSVQRCPGAPGGGLGSLWLQAPRGEQSAKGSSSSPSAETCGPSGTPRGRKPWKPALWRDSPIPSDGPGRWGRCDFENERHGLLMNATRICEPWGSRRNLDSQTHPRKVWRDQVSEGAVGSQTCRNLGVSY